MWLIEVKTFGEFAVSYTDIARLAEALSHPLHQRITLYQVLDKDNKRIVLEGIREKPSDIYVRLKNYINVW